MAHFSRKLLTAATWAVGASAVGGLLAPGAALAGATCNDPVTDAGGSTVATATDETACTFGSITGTSSSTEYWEFNWSGSGIGDITAAVSTAGSFFGDLAVYTTTDTLIATTSTTGSYTGSAALTLPGVMTSEPAGDYVVGIEGYADQYPTPDVPFSFSIDLSATTAAVPEPISLSIFGSALASLGLLRRRKNRSA